MNNPPVKVIPLQNDLNRKNNATAANNLPNNSNVYIVKDGGGGGGEWNANNPIVNNTIQVNNYNGSKANGAPSRASNKSYLKSGGFQVMEETKKKFIQCVEDISNLRTVEILGGLSIRPKKEEAINALGEQWASMMGCLLLIRESVNHISLDKTENISATEQCLSDVILASLKEIEAIYLDLVQNSSIKFLDTVCTIHDLSYQHLIDLKFDVRTWAKNNIDLIKKSLPNKRQNSKQSDDLDNEDGQKGSSSLFSSLCSCCIKKKSSVAPANDPAQRQISQNMRR